MKRYRLLVPLVASSSGRDLAAGERWFGVGPNVRPEENSSPPRRPKRDDHPAKKILTMERGYPEATAVAVAGKRILAVGSLDEVKAALGDLKFTVNDTFQSKVVLPGLIDQHPPSLPRGADPGHGGDRHGGLGAPGAHLQGGQQLRGVSRPPEGRRRRPGRKERVAVLLGLP